MTKKTKPPCKKGDIVRIGTKTKGRSIGEVISIKKSGDDYLVSLCQAFDPNGLAWGDRIFYNYAISPHTKITVLK